MQVIGLQYDIAWEDRDANHAKVADMVDTARPQRGALVVLPEMFASGFSMNVAGVVDGGERPSERFVHALAKKHGVTVVAGIVTPSRDRRANNEALVAGPDGNVLTRYHKMHPFTPGGESEHYAAGAEVTLFGWNGMNVSPLVCYDLRFPEVFRRGVRQGAQVFVVIASWPSRRAEHWTALLRARAIENQAYVVGVNRCGKDPNHVYPGRSVVFDPSGKTLAELSDAEGLLRADIDAKHVADYRAMLPFLEDMRQDFFK